MIPHQQHITAANILWAAETTLVIADNLIHQLRVIQCLVNWIKLTTLNQFQNNHFQ